MSALRLAPIGLEPLVLQVRRYSRAVLPSVRDGLEHIFDAGTLSGLQPPVALDLMPSLRRVVVARRLVRTKRRASQVKPVVPSIGLMGIAASLQFRRVATPAEC
jgi:hypothetical protein